MGELHVAFFRNLNLGHRGSPGRAELLEAFAAAGARGATSFQTNGTVVLDPGRRDPVRLVAAVRSALTPLCGWDDVAPVRPASWLRALDLDGAGDHAEMSLYDLPPGAGFPVPLPHRPERGRVTVVRADALHAICANDEPHTAYGTPTLERLLGVRVTSRSTGTVARLVTRLSSST